MLFISHRGNLHGPNPVLENTISYIDKALQDGFASEVDVIDYDDNGDNTCDYCKGKKDPKSSDNPDKAIISLKNERETSYAAYISVQNELVAAYNLLRNRRALELGANRGFRDMDFTQMQRNYKDARFVGNKEKLKALIDQIKLEFPQKLSEVQ